MSADSRARGRLHNILRNCNECRNPADGDSSPNYDFFRALGPEKKQYAPGEGWSCPEHKTEVKK